ncbi:hypothetical protein SALBM311S_05947 [Streptomyces alboniger]
MAKRKVQRRARKILGEDPVALVWCEIGKPIPAPAQGGSPGGGQRTTEAGASVAAVRRRCRVLLHRRTDDAGRQARRCAGRAACPGEGNPPAAPPRTGRPQNDPTKSHLRRRLEPDRRQLLLRWYGHSPNPERLVLLARDRVCLAASPRRTMSPTKADDFRTFAEFSSDQAHIEAEPGQPRGSHLQTPLPRRFLAGTGPPGRAGRRGPLPANGQHVTCCQWRLLVCPVE